MRTVRDFKSCILALVGARSATGVVRRSIGHRQFWNKLNTLGARNMCTHPPEQYPDIDATVELTDAEWAELTAEWNRLEGTTDAP